MKTPLQELIEWLEEKIKICNSNNLEREAMGMLEAKAIATELLEKEREGIEEAFIDGQPTNQDKVREVLNEVAELYPYKEQGNRDSYSQYNEGWQDAIASIESRLNSKKH